MDREVPDENILKDIFNRHRGTKSFVINSWKEFEDYVSKAYPILVDRAKKQALIKYGELGGKIGLFVYAPLFVPKISIIVGACSECESANNRPLISAIVVNESNHPGPGFWGLPNIPHNLHPNRMAWGNELDDAWNPEMAVFWAKEVKKVFEQWK